MANGAVSTHPYGDPLKFWTPKHDVVLTLHLAGYGYESIAAHSGFSMGHVKRIIKDPRAQKAIQAGRDRLLGSAMMSIADKLSLLGVRAVENIAQTINEETATGTKWKIHQDGVSFELLKTLGFSRKEQKDGKSGGINLTPEGEERLLTAIEKSNKAREIHVEAKVVERTAEETGGNGSGD